MNQNLQRSIPPPPPLPNGPLPSTGPYQFGAGERSQNNTNQQNGFSFTPVNSAPQYPIAADQYRPTRTGRYDMEESPRARAGGSSRSSRSTHNANRRHESSRSNRGRGDYHRRATADRPLLNFQRGNTPEQLLGMNDRQEVEKRFLDFEDMSDSAEDAMDESDPVEYEPPLQIAVPTNGSQAILPVSKGKVIVGGTREAGVHVPTKATITDSASIPKWSNPEYYTALPPPDESQRKKRDVVKLIRKARVAVGKNASSTNQVAANDDFISFDMRDDHSESDVAAAAELPRSPGRGVPGRGVPGAPSGPRSVGNYRPAMSLSHAPGTNGEGLSAEKLGPPPSNVSLNNPMLAQQGIENPMGNLKRKRSENAVAPEPLRKPKRKKGTAPFSNGYVLEEWFPGDGINAIPWMSVDHRFTENAGFRLHKEICDFYDFVKPQNFEQVVREELLHRLQHEIGIWRPGCELHCFGSFAAGLYLPNADMDVVLVSREFREGGRRSIGQSSSSMHRLARYLQDNKIAELGSIEVISGAKVPLIKFIDRITSLRVDMSFENETGLVANDTFQSWKQEYPAMPIIVTVIKQFLMMRGLNEVVNGGLGGFSVTCLVTSLLQNMPRVRTNEIVPEHHLGEILLEFLDLYGNQLDLSRTGIQMQPPGYFDKRQTYSYKPSKSDRLAIIDPNNRDNDISGGSRNVMLIFARFSRAREEILSAMRSSGRKSLLDWMLGGDYNSFLWQREHLRTIYSETTRIPQPEDVDEQYSRRETNNITKRPETLPVSLPADVLISPEEVAKMVTRSAARSGVALSSLPEIDQDDISTCESLSSESSDIDIMDHQLEVPITLHDQSTYTHAEDRTTPQDYMAVAKKMAEGNLRVAEKALRDFETGWRQTGDKPKVKGGRPRMLRRIEQCRAIVDVLPVITIPDRPAGRTRAKNNATILLGLANTKAKAQLKAQRVSKARSGTGPQSNVLNDMLRASALISQYSDIPDVPTMLDQVAARDLLTKHGVDVEKAMMELDAALPKFPPKLKDRYRKKKPKKPVGVTPKKPAGGTPKKPIGGNSKANPINID